MAFTKVYSGKRDGAVDGLCGFDCGHGKRDVKDEREWRGEEWSEGKKEMRNEMKMKKKNPFQVE